MSSPLGRDALDSRQKPRRTVTRAPEIDRVSTSASGTRSISGAVPSAFNTGEIPQFTIGDIPVVLRPRWQFANRVVNCTLAVLALIVAAPLMLLIALAVGLTSRGSIVYTQTRVGIDRRGRRARAVFDRRAADDGGLVFTIFKFRTMRVDAEKTSGAVWATPEDPRCTPIGKFLRRSRLDELPQLFNVVRGDMNIVGPRPERPRIFHTLRDSIAEYPLRQRTKPGITGWAQINHDYDANVDDVRVKVKYDLEYLARQSLWEDVKIMLKTIPVMLFRKGGW